MDMIARIRQEIERRYNKHKYSTAITEMVYAEEDEQILSFLSALEEQVCPEYCVRSHCIGCSRNDYDIWSNKPIKAKVKATGEVMEGFTDGQGNFYVFVDHDIMNRYDVNELEFDTLESEKPVPADLEEAADNHIREVADAAGHPGWDWETQDIADAFIAGAKWKKEQMLKDAVEGFVTLTLTGARTVAATIKEEDNIGFSDKVRIIIVKED